MALFNNSSFYRIQVIEIDYNLNIQTHMITDLSNGRLDQIKTFAKTHGLNESFNKALARFERYSQNGCEVNLYSDFAPLSLYFEVTRDGQFVLNGGFIYHGPHDGFGNGGAPSFSVSLDPDRVPGWSIHT